MAKRNRTQNAARALALVLSLQTVQSAAPAWAAPGLTCSDLFRQAATPKIEGIYQLPAEAEKVVDHALQDTIDQMTDAEKKKLAQLMNSEKEIAAEIAKKEKIQWWREKNGWHDTQEELDIKMKTSQFQALLLANMPSVAIKQFEALANKNEAAAYGVLITEALVDYYGNLKSSGRIRAQDADEMIASVKERRNAYRRVLRKTYLSYRSIKKISQMIAKEKNVQDTNMAVTETYVALIGTKRTNPHDQGHAAHVEPALFDELIQPAKQQDFLDLAGVKLGQVAPPNAGAQPVLQGNAVQPAAQPGAQLAGQGAAQPAVAGVGAAAAPVVAGQPAAGQPAAAADPAKKPILALSDADRAQLAHAARLVDQQFAAFFDSKRFEKDFAFARDILGDRFFIRRPSIDEMDRIYKDDAKTIEAIDERLDLELRQERRLAVKLAIASPESVEALANLVQKASERVPVAGPSMEWFFRPALEFTGIAKDSVVRKRYLPAIFEIISMKDSPDGMARLNALRQSNVRFKNDQLLVTYARMVNGTETLQQMKNKVESLAYADPKVVKANRQVVSDLWANFDARLDKAIAEANKLGDLALNEKTSPYQALGIITRAGIGASAHYLGPIVADKVMNVSPAVFHWVYEHAPNVVTQYLQPVMSATGMQ